MLSRRQHRIGEVWAEVAEAQEEELPMELLQVKEEEEVVVEEE
jgi:hypothetical protein